MILVNRKTILKIMKIEYCEMNDPEFDPVPVENTDEQRAAWHEAGHFVVARNYSLEPRSLISREGDATPETRAFAGRTFYNPTTTKCRFRNHAKPDK